MPSARFDTHALVKRLKDSGFSEPQVEAISDALQEARREQFEELATKRDLKELEATLRTAIAEMKANITKTLVYAIVAMTAIFSAIVKLS